MSTLSPIELHDELHANGAGGTAGATHPADPLGLMSQWASWSSQFWAPMYSQGIHEQNPFMQWSRLTQEFWLNWSAQCREVLNPVSEALQEMGTQRWVAETMNLISDADSVLPTASLNAMATLMGIPSTDPNEPLGSVQPGEGSRADVASAQSNLTVDASQGEKQRADQLEVIEGIGPKIAAVLREAGLTTYQSLAQTPVEEIKSILKNSGARLALAKPDSWPEQAQLLATGQLEAFAKLTSELKGGVRPT